MKKIAPSKVPNGQTLVAFRESQNPKKASSYKNFRELRDEIGVAKPRPKKSRPRAKLNRTKPATHLGSILDDLLKEEGIFEETQAQAIKEVIAWQLSQAMEKQHISKKTMATCLNTSRTQVNRILNPKTDVTLSSLQRAAALVGRRLKIELV